MVNRVRGGGARAQVRGKRERLVNVCYRSGLLPTIRRLRGLMRRDLRILAYHRVLDVADPDAFDFDLELISASPEQFREQMRLVKQRLHPLCFDEVLGMIDSGRRLPPNAIVVTFDDGYNDNHHVAMPILREIGIQATFFVSTGHIDSGLPYAYDWLVHMVCVTREARLDVPELDLQCTLPEERAKRREVAADLLDRMKWLDDVRQSALISRLEHEWRMPRAIHPACRPMTWDEVREMRSAGMEIGSHGVGHRMLAKLSAEETHAEVSDSKWMLERELGQPVNVLSYPVGGMDAYNENVIAAAKAAGYRLACNYVTGTNRLPLVHPYSLHRLRVERDLSMASFAGMTAWPEVFGYRTRHRIS